MLIGVLCEVVNEIATAEKEGAALSFVKHRIESVFHSLDIDSRSQRISKEQFETLIQNSDAIHAFHELGVDVIQLVDMADFIFQSDEVDDDFKSKDIQLSFDEFMDVVCDLRGHNFATVKDIMQLRQFIRDQNSKALHHTEDHLDHQLKHSNAMELESDSTGVETAAFSRALHKPSTTGSASSQTAPVSAEIPIGHEDRTWSHLSLETIQA